MLAESGVDLVFVLGHPEYYPRHGFVQARKHGFDAPYPILEKNSDAWMVQALREGVLDRISGRVICSDTFNEPEYWSE
jgi:putative acetyltransferase